jgi:hypothetical protein
MIAASSEIPEGEYQGIAWKGGPYATANAHAATAHGKTTCIKPALRSLAILLQCWHRYSTITLGHFLEKIV